MKKKFDFTAEMNEAQVPINDPEKIFLEKEKLLLEKNAQGIANLNKSIDIVFDNINDLTKFLKKYDLRIKQSTMAQAEKFGDAILKRFAQKIDARYTETEQGIAKAKDFICISLLYPDCPTAYLFLFLHHHDNGKR